MARFVVNSNSLFFYATADSTIVVLDTRNDLLHQFPRPFHDWKTVAIVTCPLNSKTHNPNTTTTTISSTNAIGSRKLYNELVILGTVIEGATLRKLRADLFTSQLLVNHEGHQLRYCNDDACKALALGSGFMLNLNQGVRPEITTAWKRYDLCGDDEAAAVVDVEKLAMELEERSKEVRECRSRMAEKEEIASHYKRLLEESTEVLKQKSKVVEEMERVIEEQRRVMVKKDGEIEELEVRLWEMS